MTKKDYIAIAKVINELPSLPTTTEFELVRKASLVARLARYFEQDNPRFDSAKFDKACYAKGK